MTCRDCTHWALKRASLSEYGFGRCKEETTARQAVHQVSASNVCRIGRFQQASPETLAKRREAFP